MMGVTLIMPMYNEAADIEDVLQSLAMQTFSHAATTVVIVDGGSRDGSREMAETWLANSDFDGEVLRNPQRTIPTSLNAGLRAARGEDIIIRLDAHTTYASDYVGSIVDAFENAPASVGTIGGAQLPRPEKDLNRAIVVSLYTNPMGLGGAAFRRATGPRLVEGVYLGAWRPGVLQAAGGFDEHWEANEDGELAARVREMGYATLFVPLQSSYRVKRGASTAVRQWGRYGYWRAQTLRRHPAAFRLRHLAPPLAIAVALGLLLTPLRAWTAVPYALYVLAIWANRQAGEAALVTLADAVFFPACQAAWGIGLLRGLLEINGPARARKSPEPLARSMGGARVEPV